MTAAVVTALTPKLSAYTLLIEMLRDQRISVREFETLFLQLYQDDPTDWPFTVLDVLESLFADLDELFGPTVIDASDHAEDDFRQRAYDALAVLQEVAA